MPHYKTYSNAAKKVLWYGSKEVEKEADEKEKEAEVVEEKKEDEEAAKEEKKEAGEVGKEKEKEKKKFKMPNVHLKTPKVPDFLRSKSKERKKVNKHICLFLR